MIKASYKETKNMRFVIQRVTESEVKVDGETLGKIGKRIYGANRCQ